MWQEKMMSLISEAQVTEAAVELRRVAKDLSDLNQAKEVDLAIKRHLSPHQAARLREIFLDMAIGR